LKVLHIITDLNNGGAEAVLFRLISNDRNNVHCVISMMGNGIYGERLVNLGVQVDTLDMPRGRITFKGLIRLFKILKSMKPDVVQTWMYHADLVGGVLARFAGIKSIVWGIRSSYIKDITILQTKITIWLCALLSKWIPSVIVSNSQHALELHEKIGYAANKLRCIPNGYFLDDFQPSCSDVADFTQECNISNDYILIGMVARFDPYKDHENLFKALSIVRKQESRFKCVLVGTDMDKNNQSLMQLLKKYQADDVTILVGPRNDIPNVMSALDLHILSSVAESFPNVIAEAMACSVPCVSTDVGDAALIIGDTGWVVPPSDADAMAVAMRDALNSIDNKTTWLARKERCRKRISDKYTLDKMIRAYSNLWASVI